MDPDETVSTKIAELHTLRRRGRHPTYNLSADMFPCVADVLATPEIQRGKPLVLAGAEALDRPVRWVHVSELPDIAPLLRGGELILTTGIALPTDPAELVRYVDDLSQVPAAGIVIELGRAYEKLPPSLVAAAKRRALPLIALRREIRFVQVTEAVHSTIVHAQVERLLAAQTVHQQFTRLSVEGASPDGIVRQAAALSHRPVVLESMARHVVAFDFAGVATAEILEDWEMRSRSMRNGVRTECIEGDEIWLVTAVGARGELWGRLVMILESEATPLHVTIVEQAATALALNRLVEQHRETLEQQTHRNLLTDIRSGTYSSVAELHYRAEALGVQLRERSLIGGAICVDPPPASKLGVIEQEAELSFNIELVVSAMKAARVPALVGALSSGDIGLVVPLESSIAASEVLESLSSKIHSAFARRSPTPCVTIGVGSVVNDVRDLQRSLLEAEHVVGAGVGQDDGKLYYQLPDVRIRGVLHVLRNDPRIQTFVERELKGLLGPGPDSEHLVEVLEVYLSEGRNKVSTAKRLSISRPALYQRLKKIEEMLGVSLESAESSMSIHFALMALQVLRQDAQRTTSVPPSWTGHEGLRAPGVL